MATDFIIRQGLSNGFKGYDLLVTFGYVGTTANASAINAGSAAASSVNASVALPTVNASVKLRE